ncbi:hypothetical protein ACGFJC_14250 [Nonomuraea fuscirosea]|uniref:hypothetical protein n=1 Tax=Nonomuraea fuscirosea TaxID=1291556 RepID=UPI003710B6AC
MNATPGAAPDAGSDPAPGLAPDPGPDPAPGPAPDPALSPTSGPASGPAPGSVRDGVPGDPVAALVGRQLRQALRTVGAVAALLAGPPVLAMWVPDPRAWVVLSLAVQGVWVGLAVLQLRRAERLER